MVVRQSGEAVIVSMTGPMFRRNSTSPWHDKHTEDVLFEEVPATSGDNPGPQCPTARDKLDPRLAPKRTCNNAGGDPHPQRGNGKFISTRCRLECVCEVCCIGRPKSKRRPLVWSNGR